MNRLCQMTQAIQHKILMISGLSEYCDISCDRLIRQFII